MYLSYTWLKSLFNESTEADTEVMRIKRAYEKALRLKSQNETERSAENQNGTKYSIMTIPGTNQKYVQADRLVIKGDDPANWEAFIFDYIDRVIADGQPMYITTTDDDVLTINKTTAWKMGDRNIRNKKGEIIGTLSDELYSVKAHIAAHIDEVAKISKYDNITADKNNRHDINNFSYRSVYFRDYDGTYYKVKLSVKELTTDSILYNAGKIEKRSAPGLSRGSSDKAAEGGDIGAQGVIPLDDSIRNNSEKNNSKPETVTKLLQSQDRGRGRAGQGTCICFIISQIHPF